MIAASALQADARPMSRLKAEAIRIHSPQPLSCKLTDQKWIGASTEAAHEYKNLDQLAA
jgi:hypothetical protein